MSIKESTVILARVSSKSQEDEGYSLDSQLKLLQSYCQANDLKVVKIYKIAETASKEQSRKVFSELLDYIATNDIYNLAVEKTDRLTRNLRDAVAIDDWLQGDGDRMLHAVKENIKLHRESKSDVKFMWNIHLAVAKKYTDNLREEAMKGWTEKLAQGHMPSRPPAGYMTTIQNGKRIHIPDPKTAPIIKKAFDLYLKPAESTITVWAFLAQAGITTYNGRPMAKSAVHKLLQNSYYMGIIQFNGETYPGAHQPIIDKKLYQAVQDKMHNKRPSKRRKHDVALRNIILCGHCGKVITWQLQRGNLYGSCQRDLPECRKQKFLREGDVHQLLVQKMSDLISPSPDILQWLVSQLNDDFKDTNATSEQYKQNIRDRIARLTRMDETLYDDKLAGDVSRDRYETKHTDIVKQLEEAHDELLIADTTTYSKHKDAIDLIELTQAALDQYLDDNLTNDAKRIVLTKLFDEITYEGQAVSVKYRFLAQSIAKRSLQTKEILKEEDVLNQTTKNNLVNRGRSGENIENSLLFPIWQGHVESNHDPRFWRPIY